MPLAFAPDEHHPMVDALLRPRVPRWEELNRAIDERDDMLDFATATIFGQDRDASLVSYFQNGLEQFEIVRHVAAWRGEPLRKMLDFASGYGRLTRFLVHERLAEEITVSDILEGGMEFQAGQFGVKTIVSTPLPENFVAAETYDLIFVASLFTHLPPSTFGPWLRRLAELLEPRGLLLFTVHDEHLAPERVGEGISFAGFSESRVLDVSEYGSTWVTDEYVREQVALIDPGFACIRMPRALSEWQDLYVISPVPIAYAPPRKTVKGALERCDLLEDSIRFAGWATVGDELPDRIEIRLDDEVIGTSGVYPHRADVAARFGTEVAAQSGFEIRVPYARVRSFRYQVLTVSAFTRANVERIFFLGTIDSAAGFIARERARDRDQQLEQRLSEIAGLHHRLGVVEHERATLEQQIEAMRQSRFWKARERWFRIKRSAGLTDEQ